MMSKYRTGMSGCALWAAVIALSAAPALAENVKAAVAFTPTAAVAGFFNGHYEGYFAKGGLDTTLLLQSNSVGVVAAVQADQAEIGSAATGVFFGAVQNGLDYVALGCQTTFGPGNDVLGVIPRNGAVINSPADFVGKRVAVPGVHGGTHVAFMEWLREKGVDPNSVTYVEVKYPQQADILRGTTVDAVVTSEPYMARIVKAGLGKVFSNLNDTELSVPDSFYFAKRSWADAHPEATASFIAGLAEGVKFASENPEKSIANTAEALEQDVEFISAAGKQNFCSPDTAKYIEQLNTVMISLGLATKPLDADVVVWKKP
ncbi:ABC-type nitrate/sulfonate/bicarbonate transport system, periplasmic component [Hoeflea sp. IMCC20628]|uniref:ABC transporter substrate-binding protein n=1 Tax=Hoeflea sp. IMCC20628 TaxID=1620421 RepID=UPI00063BDE34|nr:ABC transporter substrate-binding protein [Hoeflea sp. IMCC20628]AKI02689.1 ABC-type nitrate/sulfonate/bicarbonate transport system, periplasmic component [Hoeflea sp. IMCC20628]